MSMPFFKNHREHHLQDFLMAYADALVSGTRDADSVLEQLDEDMRGQIDDLLSLTDQISKVLTEVAPSDEFVARLRYRLTEAGDSANRSLWTRIRRLPPRTQLAAGIGGATLTAGVVLLAARTLPEALDLWRNRHAAAA
jgi:hypothetical protein